MKRFISAFFLLAILFSGSLYAAEGDSNFTNVVASGDITAGDDLTVTDDLVITDDLSVDAISAASIATTGDSTLGNSALDKTTITGHLYIPYQSKTAKAASGTSEGVIILTKGLRREDCGHGTAGNSNVWTVCFSDGTDWIPV